MTITAVGFDLDETLAVPTRDREAILADAVDAVGAPALSRERYLEIHSQNLTSETRVPIFEAMLAEFGSDVDPTELADTYRQKIAEAVAPVPGAEKFLQRLREEYRVGLLTNGPSTAQRHKLETLGWTDLFDVALVTGELAAGKPDPAAFEALVDGLGSAPEETAFVGDDVTTDIGGAADAGLVPIQVTFEGGPSPSPRAAAHLPRDRLVEELPALLEDI